MPRNNHPKVKADKPQRSAVKHQKINPLIAKYLNKNHIPLREVEVVNENSVVIYNKRSQ